MDLIGPARHPVADLQVSERPWDRLKGETKKAHEAFKLFLDQAGKRSIQGVATLLACSRANVTRWSTRWRWQERAHAFDLYQDRIEQEALTRERIGMRKRLVKDGVAMQLAASDGLSKLKEHINRKKKPLRLSASDIARLAEVGVKLERCGRGEDDDQYGTFEIRVVVDPPPPDNAEDLAAARAAVEAALLQR